MASLAEHQQLAAGEAPEGFGERARHTVKPLLIAAVAGAAALPEMFLYGLHATGMLTRVAPMEWDSHLLTLYVITNLVVGVSSVVISVTLFALGGRKKNSIALLWPLVGVGLFCVSNALAHIALLATGLKPEYWLALSIQYISGVTAMALAITLPPLIPSFLRVLRAAQSSDRNKNMLQVTNVELVKANDSLRVEVGERRKAEDKERTNLQRVRGIIDNLPLGAIAFDEYDRVLHANDLFCQLFELGVESSSLIGHHSTEFAGLVQKQIRNKDEYAQHLEQVSTTRQPQLGAEIVFRDGRILAQDYIPLFANGHYTGQLFLYRDITREKRIDATKSEFMSLASHQLRTPLTTMRWSFGRLNRSLQGRMTVSEEKLLMEAKSAAGRMAHTIDTMLAISRVEAGKISLEVSEIKLGNAINEVRTEVREEYEQKHQSFTIDCPPNIQVHTDQFVFKEVVRNLFTNAIKYTPHMGRIHVRVTTLHQHVQIDVSDTGYGIPTHQQEKIFTKFFRGDNVVQRDTEGTGLGLYLVFLLVKLLGATIFFVSEEGKGTTFTVLLPRFPAAVRPGAEAKTI